MRIENLLNRDIINAVNEFKKLNEGLILSQDRDQMMKLLNNANLPFKYSIIEFRVFTDEPLNKTQASKLKQILSIAGWYVCLPNDKTKKGFNENWWYDSKAYAKTGKDFESLELEPKFEVEISNTKLPDILYHVAPRKNRDHIYGKGLTPRSHTKLSNHPDRLYFATSWESVEHILDRFKSHIDGELDVWAVKPHKIPMRRWFVDTNFSDMNPLTNEIDAGGVFTINSIGRYYLKLVNDQFDDLE